MKLHIADNLELPVDAVTEAIAVLGIRRSGKSYTVRRLAEQLAKASQQIVIVDPKGDWWGIRSSADGKSPGLPITILGGEHGDVPLEVGAGEIIAKLAVEENVSMLLDLSLMRKGAVAEFMGGKFGSSKPGFLEALYHLKAREQYRTPMALILDEADAIAPQKPYKGEERMLGAAEDIVRRGGQRGIGCTMATQRPAVLNKNVLTQCPTLIALRTTGSQDIDAIDEWIKKHGNPEKRKLLMDSIAMLPTGDAWFWNPAWPTPAGIFQRAHVLPIETFDSGATPKAGAKRIEPKKVAEVDLGALRERMAETIERAKADDPKTLRARIAQLERDLKAKAPAAKAQPDPQAEERAYQRGVVEGRKEVDRIAKQWEAAVPHLNKVSTLMGEAFVGIISARNEAKYQPPPVVRGPSPACAASKALRSADRVRRGSIPAEGFSALKPVSNGSGLPTGERAILTVCAQYPDGAAREQLTVLTGYKRSSRDTYIQRLREKGFVEATPDAIIATGDGVAALGPHFEPLPTGDELREYWLDRLPEGERKILEVLIQKDGMAVEREQLDEITGYKRSSRDTYIQRLKARQLVELVGRGEIKASEILFE